MTSFSILLKKELKENLFSKGKGEKRDFLSLLFTLIIFLCVVVGLIYIALSIAESYVTLSFEGITDKTLRSLELLNILYLAFGVFLLFFILEKERKIIVGAKDKAIILRLPIRSSSIFLSKFLVTYLLSLFTTLCFMVPVNIIFYVAIGNFKATYLIGLIVNILTFPMLPFLLATILLVPYIKILNFFKDKQLLTLIVFVILIGACFYLYSLLLDVFRTLLETGSIKFLFNTDNIRVLNNIYKYSYPLNMFASVSLGYDMLLSYLVILGVVIVSILVTYFLSRLLFYQTLYSNMGTKDKLYKTRLKQRNPFVSLLKKEFLLTYRDNNNLFSYFAIAIAMPLMIYVCLTLFRDLIYNAIGLEMDFVLAIFLLFIFIVLTNTYASTNISREGEAFLKNKTFPYSAKKIFLAKVVFALIISSLSVIVSVIVITTLADISAIECIILLVCGILFSLSQILLGTKMDLNKANLKSSSYEASQNEQKTISKLVFSGLIVSLILGVLLVVTDVLLPSVSVNLPINLILIGLVVIITVIYLGYAIFFYLHKLEDRFVSLVL